jgi:hypothetical protein
MRADEGEKPGTGENRRRAGTVTPRPFANAPDATEREHHSTEGT